MVYLFLYFLQYACKFHIYIAVYREHYIIGVVKNSLISLHIECYALFG